MSRSHTSLAILVVLLALLAVALGLYGLLVWQRSDVALTGAILLLGLAQLLSLFWRRRHAARGDGREDGAVQRDREHLAENIRRLDRLSADHAALGAELEQVQQRLAAIEGLAAHAPELEQHVEPRGLQPPLSA